MSKYHGEQYWSQMRQHTLHGWQDINDEDIEKFNTIRHNREVRLRDQRARARRERHIDHREIEA